MSPKEFREEGHRLVDWLADYHSTLHKRSVMSGISPGQVRGALPRSAPVQPEPFSEIMNDVDRTIVPGLTLWQHPEFFGYFPANAQLASVLADFLSTGLGVLGLSWQAAPALTELEEVVCDWMRQMLGLSESWKGVIQDTASACTLVALICARERSSNYGLTGRGLQGGDSPLVVYASEHSHSSVEKAALLAGFGRQHLRSIPCDKNYAMCPDALAITVEADLKAGLRPCAVVATTGTTATTAIDPIDKIHETVKRYGIWVHVDAAMAGSAMILPECRWMWSGVESADSIVVNAHKWLGAAFDCSLYFVRDPQHLIRVMSTNPSYLQTSADGAATNFRDWGIPLGRRFRALKLWALLRTEGVARLQQRLRRDMENARWLAGMVSQEPHWQVVAPVSIQTVCIRHDPPGWSHDEREGHTLRWVESLNRSGVAYVTPAKLDGRWMVRVSIGAINTEREHVQAVWDAMQREVENSMRCRDS